MSVGMTAPELTCPICSYTAPIFTPAGTIKTEGGKRKLRSCPRCSSDEWSRLVHLWVTRHARLPRQARSLTLSAPLPLRAGLIKLAGRSLVDAETIDLAQGAFAREAFDLVIVGENWSHESGDIALAAAVHDVLRPGGWFVALPGDAATAAHRVQQLDRIGFKATVDARIAAADRELHAIDPAQPFFAARKAREASAVAGPPAGDASALTWFLEEGPAPEIRPAPLARSWMDATPEQFAYRCLPLNIANTQSWELLCLSGLTATWNGTAAIDAITISSDDGTAPSAISHFGSGVLTFGVKGLFRTPPGIDLYVTGPVNRPKAGIQALSAVVEVDWAEMGFTMNWIFTDSGRPVRFEKGEPFCAIFPVPRGLAESMEPAIRRGDCEPDLWRRHVAHRMSRQDFNEALKVEGSTAQAKAWQRNYFQGPDTPVTPEHRTKVRLKPFRRIE
jgi:SAM-dependent methyltransferase